MELGGGGEEEDAIHLIRGSRCGAKASLGSSNTGLEDGVVGKGSFTRARIAFSALMLSRVVPSTASLVPLRLTGVFECKCRLYLEKASEVGTHNIQLSSGRSRCSAPAQLLLKVCVFHKSGGVI